VIIPSQIRSNQPLQVEEQEDGTFSFVNAYEGDWQEFFPGRPTKLRQPEMSSRRTPFREPSHEEREAPAPQLEDTAVQFRRPLTSGSVEELRAQIKRQLFEELDPEKEADPRDIEEIYELLKCTGSQCVSQIAVETGLSWRRILLAIRQLLKEGLVDWLPDSRCDNIQLLETAWAIRRVLARRVGKIDASKAA
jgi:hypothetical protein